jgi:hypothetical protein
VAVGSGASAIAEEGLVLKPPSPPTLTIADSTLHTDFQMVISAEYQNRRLAALEPLVEPISVDVTVSLPYVMTGAAEATETRQSHQSDAALYQRAVATRSLWYWDPGLDIDVSDLTIAAATANCRRRPSTAGTAGAGVHSSHPVSPERGPTSSSSSSSSIPTASEVQASTLLLLPPQCILSGAATIERQTALLLAMSAPPASLRLNVPSVINVNFTVPLLEALLAVSQAMRAARRARRAANVPERILHLPPLPPTHPPVSVASPTAAPSTSRSAAQARGGLRTTHHFPAMVASNGVGGTVFSSQEQEREGERPALLLAESDPDCVYVRNDTELALEYWPQADIGTDPLFGTDKEKEKYKEGKGGATEGIGWTRGEIILPFSQAPIALALAAENSEPARAVTFALRPALLSNGHNSSGSSNSDGGHGPPPRSSALSAAWPLMRDVGVAGDCARTFLLSQGLGGEGSAPKLLPLDALMAAGAAGAARGLGDALGTDKGSSPSTLLVVAELTRVDCSNHRVLVVRSTLRLCNNTPEPLYVALVTEAGAGGQCVLWERWVSADSEAAVPLQVASTPGAELILRSVRTKMTNPNPNPNRSSATHSKSKRTHNQSATSFSGSAHHAHVHTSSSSTQAVQVISAAASARFSVPELPGSALWARATGTGTGRLARQATGAAATAAAGGGRGAGVSRLRRHRIYPEAAHKQTASGTLSYSFWLHRPVAPEHNPSGSLSISPADGFGTGTGSDTTSETSRGVDAEPVPPPLGEVSPSRPHWVPVKAVASAQTLLSSSAAPTSGPLYSTETPAGHCFNVHVVARGFPKAGTNAPPAHGHSIGRVVSITCPFSVDNLLATEVERSIFFCIFPSPSLSLSLSLSLSRSEEICASMATRSPTNMSEPLWLDKQL